MKRSRRSVSLLAADRLLLSVSYVEANITVQLIQLVERPSGTPSRVSDMSSIRR